MCSRYVEIVEVGKTRPKYQSVRNQGNRFTLKNPQEIMGRVRSALNDAFPRF